ncbi:MAG: Crp/Fnr family transcriptional regulator [Ardenticatenaceae bacterium]|nr:MAG: Crp/Fnr family transcriptional regulator [Ardenticatenaceae bacterium]
MPSLMKWLTDNPIFATLADKEREHLAKTAIQKKYAAGEWIAPYGDVWPYLFLVTAGSIQALKESTEGRSLIVLTLKPGELFWGTAFFEEAAVMPVLLQAQSDSQIYLWSQDQMVPWLWQNGRFSWELSRLMVRRMMRASAIVEDLAFKPVASRLAGLLLDTYQDTTSEPVPRSLTLDQMAAHIGTTREMVCRLLYRFSDQNLIHITRTEFVLNNRSGLIQLTGQEDSHA